MRNSIVIPLVATFDGNEELRYALRSIEKNVRNYKDIWIIGDLPDWLQNVEHIPFSPADHPKWKERNIRDRYMAASMNPRVTENFLATNDDIFVLREIDATNYPYYNKGKWISSVHQHIGSYKKTALHSYNFCIRRGFPADNVDSHCPIIYNRKEYSSALNVVDFLTPYGLGVKTVYCAVNRITTQYSPDCKFKAKTSYEEVVEGSKGRDVISCYDGAMEHGVGQFLREMFPEKSKYEI